MPVPHIRSAEARQEEPLAVPIARLLVQRRKVPCASRNVRTAVDTGRWRAQARVWVGRRGVQSRERTEEGKVGSTEALG